MILSPGNNSENFDQRLNTVIVDVPCLLPKELSIHIRHIPGLTSDGDLQTQGPSKIFVQIIRAFQNLKILSLILSSCERELLPKVVGDTWSFIPGGTSVSSDFGSKDPVSNASNTALKKLHPDMLTAFRLKTELARQAPHLKIKIVQ